MHIQRVNTEVIRSKLNTFEYLSESQQLAVSEQHGFLGILLVLTIPLRRPLPYIR
jgi:hypothetical protein